jgi:hypothetical protein
MVTRLTTSAFLLFEFPLLLVLALELLDPPPDEFAVH